MKQERAAKFSGSAAAGKGSANAMKRQWMAKAVENLSLVARLGEEVKVSKSGTRIPSRSRSESGALVAKQAFSDSADRNGEIL
jgi:hypothetical protein